MQPPEVQLGSSTAYYLRGFNNIGMRLCDLLVLFEFMSVRGVQEENEGKSRKYERRTTVSQPRSAAGSRLGP